MESGKYWEVTGASLSARDQNFPQKKSEDGPGGEGGGPEPEGQQEVKRTPYEGGGSTYKPDIFDRVLSQLNTDLMICKTFYFFFFAAFGCLFPLMGVYFKQLAMTPTHCGFLIGIRPLIEFFATPFWGAVSEKYHKKKHILLLSLLFWIVATLVIVFIQPAAKACLYNNGTNTLMTGTYSGVHLRTRRPAIPNVNVDMSKLHPEVSDIIGMSPIPIDASKVVNMSPQEAEQLVRPPFSNILYKKSDVEETFVILLFITLVGEFLSAPAMLLADLATFNYLGDKPELYGRQRMIGSVGWALALFFVGVALDHSTTFPDHPCGHVNNREKNYTISFAVFSVLMSCALITATQFRYHENDRKLMSITKFLKKVQGKGPTPPPQQHLTEEQEAEQARLEAEIIERQLNIRLQSAEGGNAAQPLKTDEGGYEFQPTSLTLMLKAEIGRWGEVLREWRSLKIGVTLFIAWFMGFGISLVWVFLFWHLQDLGGAPTLFGLASIINHASEIFAFFFMSRVIKQFGHVKIIYAAIIANVARFLYISWLRSPWWVLPFEFVQGLTHAGVWTICSSYLIQRIPEDLKPSAQTVLQGIHHTLGRGLGSIIGGIMITYIGSAVTFRVYGFSCVVVLCAYVAICYATRKKEPTPEDQKGYLHLDDATALAPCGVPVNPMAVTLAEPYQKGATAAVDQENPNAAPPVFGTDYGAVDQYESGGGGGNAMVATAEDPYYNDNAEQQHQHQQQWPGYSDSQREYGSGNQKTTNNQYFQ